MTERQSLRKTKRDEYGTKWIEKEARRGKKGELEETEERGGEKRGGTVKREGGRERDKRKEV